MKNVIYWNDLWLNVTESGGKESNLPDDIKVKFYNLVEDVIVKNGEYFLTTEDLESEYIKNDSKYAKRHYFEVKHSVGMSWSSSVLITIFMSTIKNLSFH